MSKPFTAVVKYGTRPEPMPTRFGDKYNVALEIEGEAPTGSLDDRGYAVVWREVSHRDVPYLKSLRSGDRINVIWNTAGKRAFWELSDAADLADEAPAARPVSASRPSGGETAVGGRPIRPAYWEELTADELMAFQAILAQNCNLLAMAVNTAESNETLSAMPLEDKRALAVTAFIQSQREFQRGLSLPPEPMDEGERDSAFLDGLSDDPFEFVESVLASIAEFSDEYETTGEVIAILKEMGYSSADLNMSDRPRILEIAREVWGK